MKRQPRQSDELVRFASLSRAAGFQYFKAINEALVHDTQLATDEVLERKSGFGDGPVPAEKYQELGFWYRTLARAFFSYVEGILYVMRVLTLHAIERGEVQVSPLEHAALSETTYAISVDQKRVEARGTTNRLLENFVITFKFFPQVFGSTYRVDYSSHGWRAFQTLVRLRNDITHPKSVEDVLLQPELPNTARDACSWFYGLMAGLFSKVDTKLLEESQRETHLNPQIVKQLEELRSSRPRQK